MIGFEEARKRVVEHCRPLPPAWVPLARARGLVIAEDLRSPLDLPHFDNSAMDGFALSSGDTRRAAPRTPVRLRISGVVRAGRLDSVRLVGGTACRIMTGAPLPPGADAVLEKESAVVEGDSLLIDRPVGKGRHVRYRSEEIRKGSGVGLRGAVVSPAVAGFLSGLGLDEVRVYPRPRVSLVVTGDELRTRGSVLKRGQIYDSNTPLILAALESQGVIPTVVKRVPDDPRALVTALSVTTRRDDLVIVVGGMSVGDHDPMRYAVPGAGIRTVFWKVSQKPGKPFFFGMKGRVPVLGLPGNPASAHACFYQYVRPAIKRLMGREDVFLEEESRRLKREVKADSRKTLLLRARACVRAGRPACEVLPRQGSHMLSSLCGAHGFIVLPPGKKRLGPGSEVRFQRLPET